MLTPNRSQCSESTPTHRHEESFVLSRGWKVMTTIFLGLQRRAAGGLPSTRHKTTTTGPYYSELLKELSHAFKEKLRVHADPMSSAAA